MRLLSPYAADELTLMIVIPTTEKNLAEKISDKILVVSTLGDVRETRLYVQLASLDLIVKVSMNILTQE